MKLPGPVSPCTARRAVIVGQFPLQELQRHAQHRFDVPAAGLGPRAHLPDRAALVFADAEHRLEAGQVQRPGVEPVPGRQMADEILGDAELLLRRRRRMHPGGAVDPVHQ